MAERGGIAYCPTCGSHDRERGCPECGMPCTDEWHGKHRLGATEDRYRKALERIRSITMENWHHSGEMANAMDRIEDISDAALDPERD